ncbi:baseplate wedge subunit [Synechococcus phage S-CBM2]|nr:baseplate wedge subunit [Synechococcus phage S-CBM2]
MATRPSNLTTLDFEEIKESIKSYLRTRTEFSDYDFEGSTLSYLLDILAYNTYYTAFNANLSVNELFLSTSTIRDNVVNILKYFNYTPDSISASKTVVNLTMVVPPTVDGDYPNTVRLKAGTVLATRIDNQSYLFSIPEDAITSVNSVSGIATWQNLTVFEGQLLNYSYVVDKTNPTQRFVIPNENVDISTLKVYVRQSENSSIRNNYVKANTIIDLDEKDRVYFIQEVEDLRYEVFFGDGVFGRESVDGEVVELYYIQTTGSEGNGAGVFSFTGTVTDNIGRDITEDASITVVSKSAGGAEAESLEKIKFKAPRLFSTQNRAVTAKDYESIFRSIYADTDDVIAYGGEELSPPEYGKVYVAVKTKSGLNIDSNTKRNLVRTLKDYTVASIIPVVVDAKVLEIEIRTTAYYNINTTNLSPNEIRNYIYDAIYNYVNSESVKKFDGKFKYSKLQSAIDNAHPSINSNLTKLRIRKCFPPSFAIASSYCIDFHQPLFNECMGKASLASSGFKALEYGNDMLYMDEDGMGNLRLFKLVEAEKVYVSEQAGRVNYSTGVVDINTITVTETELLNTIKISVIPDSFDIVSVFDVYLSVNGSDCGIAPVVNVIPDIAGIQRDSTLSNNTAPSDFGSGTGGGVFGDGSGVGSNGTATAGGGTTGSITSTGGGTTGSGNVVNTTDDLDIIAPDDDAPTCF